MMKQYEKVVVLDSVILYPEHRHRLNEIAKEVVEYNTCTSEQEVLERVKDADCIISCWVDISNRVIDENPQLKTVAFWTHAFEHRIDRDYALNRGIYVPCIPDYGTDSVAELVFVGLLRLYGTCSRSMSVVPASRPRQLQEEIMAAIAEDVRKLDRNWHDNLRGKWVHEYIKAGKQRIASPDGFPEETLKGLTVGFLGNGIVGEDLLNMVSKGFRMNAIHSMGDLQHALNIAYRPVDSLLRESHIVVYNSKIVSKETRDKINQGEYLSVVDASKIVQAGESLKNRRLGIIGLGRIGGRVAQIARDGFDMDVSYYSRTRKPEIEKQYDLQSKSLERVLTESDIISFHLPHVGAEKYVTNEMVAMIPKRTTVTNVSVGNIFEDQEYFLSRFEEGDLNGYIDVYETLPPRQELKKRKDHLIATYRSGWRTRSTIGLKSHKLITRMREGLYKT